MLTIFTTPKPFKGNIKTIQLNAIQSWTKLEPGCEILLFGDEEGTAEIADELGIKQITAIERNEYGTPLISSIIEITQQIATHELICYVNADIILMSDFTQAVSQIEKRPFLMVGQRWDIDIDGPIDFGNHDWEKQLRNRLYKEGRLHSPFGIDYFVFPRGLYHNIPPFAVGRPGWDNWMIYWARSSNIPVIDATKVITAVHQHHDYSHHPMGKAGVYKGPEAQQNRSMIERRESLFCIKDATHVLTLKGLQAALSFKHLCYRLSAVTVLNSRLRFLIPIIHLPLRALRIIRGR